MKKSLYLFIFLTAVLFSQSCKETPDAVDYQPNIQAAKDYITAEDIFIEIFNVFFKAVQDTTLISTGYSYIDACGVLRGVDKLTFDYGQTDRLCPDNKFRRGTFVAVFNGEMFVEGTKATITPDDFFVDGDQVEGLIEIENLGKNTSDKVKYSFKLKTGKITWADTTQISFMQYAIDYQMTWQVGDHTPGIPEDDILTIIGKASGVSTLGDAFNLNINQDLYDRLDCNWIVLGITNLNIPSVQVLNGTIDYILEDDCNYRVNFNFNNNLFYHNLKY